MSSCKATNANRYHVYLNRADLEAGKIAAELQLPKQMPLHEVADIARRYYGDEAMVESLGE